MIRVRGDTPPVVSRHSAPGGRGWFIPGGRDRVVMGAFPPSSSGVGLIDLGRWLRSANVPVFTPHSYVPTFGPIALI